jgi:hypothetical protein
MSRLLAILLLVGSLALIFCAILHPVLPLTAKADLDLIVATPHWRWIHLGLLHATGLIIAGIWARWLSAEPAERDRLAVAFLVLGIGQALNGVNIAFMAGAGTTFAGMHAAGIDVLGVYQATHAAAVMCGRLAGFLVAVAAGIVAATTGGQGKEPRGLVWLAWLACVGGLVGNLLAPPGHPIMLTSVGLMAVWQTVTAVRLLGAPRS